MFDTIVDQLLNSLPHVFCGLLIMMAIAAMIMTTLNRRQKQAAKRRLDDEEKAKKERRDLQVKLGNEALDRFREAARKNTHCNILPSGRIAENIGTISIVPMPTNGTAGYSILPFMRDDKSINGRIEIFQLDINLDKKGEEIHVFGCPYGPEHKYPIDSYTEVISNLCEELRYFSPFPETEELFRAGKLKKIAG